MIANITRGANPGNIGAYLHGPGTANEHQYVDARNIRHHGGVVIGGNLHLDGDAMPDTWVKEFRAAMRTRPEIKNPIWHVSLRNTERDRTLSNADWADAGQTFAEHMGFAEHPWVMVATVRIMCTSWSPGSTISVRSGMAATTVAMLNAPAPP